MPLFTLHLSLALSCPAMPVRVCCLCVHAHACVCSCACVCVCMHLCVCVCAFVVEGFQTYNTNIPFRDLILPCKSSWCFLWPCPLSYLCFFLWMLHFKPLHAFSHAMRFAVLPHLAASVVHTTSSIRHRLPHPVQGMLSMLMLLTTALSTDQHSQHRPQPLPSRGKADFHGRSDVYSSALTRSGKN